MASDSLRLKMDPPVATATSYRRLLVRQWSGRGLKAEKSMWCRSVQLTGGGADATELRSTHFERRPHTETDHFRQNNWRRQRYGLVLREWRESRLRTWIEELSREAKMSTTRDVKPFDWRWQSDKHHRYVCFVTFSIQMHKTQVLLLNVAREMLQIQEFIWNLLILSAMCAFIKKSDSVTTLGLKCAGKNFG